MKPAIPFPEAEPDPSRARGMTAPADAMTPIASTELRQRIATGESVLVTNRFVTGPLDLEALDLSHGLVFRHCVFEHGLVVREARGSTIRLVDCDLPHLDATRLVLHGDLRLDESRIGSVDLAGASVDGTVSLRHARLVANPHCEEQPAVAFSAERVAAGVLDAEGCDIRGEFRLVSSTIGFITLHNARLSNPSSCALRGDGLHVAGDVLCWGGFSAIGEFRLAGAEIGTLSMNGATLAAPGRTALYLDGATIAHGAYFNESFHALGTVSMRGVAVSILTFSDAQLVNPGATALDGDRLTIEHTLFCDRASFAGTVRLCGAQVRGDLIFADASIAGRCAVALDAEGATVSGALAAGSLAIQGQVRLVRADIGGKVDITGAVIAVSDPAQSGGGAHPALDASRVRVGGDFIASGATINGGLCLAGGHITGDAFLEGAELDNEQGPTFDFDEAMVDHGMHCDDMRAAGPVTLRGAAARMISLNRALLTGPLDGDGLKVAGDLFGTQLRAERGLRLRGARIGVVTLDRAELTSPPRPSESNAAPEAANLARRDGHSLSDQAGADAAMTLPGASRFAARATADPSDAASPAFDGERLTVDAAMFCRELSVQGEVRFRDAQIRSLSLDGAVVAAAAGAGRRDRAMALDFRESTIPRLNLRLRRPAAGLIDFQGAQVGTLWDGRATWWARSDDGDLTAAVRLHGFTYDALDERCDMSVAERRQWLALDKSKSTQPYAVLIAHYRRVGENAIASRVGLDRERAKRPGLGRLGKAWSDFLFVTVGYGYRFRRTLLFLLPLVVIGSLVFATQHPQHLHTAAVGARFQPVIYTVDVLVPVIQLNQQNGWVADGPAQWAVLGLRLVGWLLTTAVVAGIGSVLRRD